MKIGSLAAARPSNYDRNATSIIGVYDATVAPHGQTQRTTYTVPAARKAVLEHLLVRCMRTTAATVAGSVYLFARVYSGATSATLAYPVSNPTTTNVVVSEHVYSGVTIYAAESLQSYTTDGSTGGDNFFVIGIKATEFDA